MSTEANSIGAGRNQLFTALSVLTLIISLSGFYVFSDQSTLLRALGMIAGTIASLAFLMQASAGQNAWEYLKGTRLEVRKVVWPTRKETTQTTLIVVVMVFVVGVFLWLVDKFFMWAAQSLTGS